MTKLNIFQVNGVWQLGRPHQAGKEDDEEDQLAQEDVQDGQPEPTIPNQTELLTQILTKIENMNIWFDMMDQIEDTLRHSMSSRILIVLSLCYCHYYFYFYFSC